MDTITETIFRIICSTSAIGGIFYTFATFFCKGYEFAKIPEYFINGAVLGLMFGLISSFIGGLLSTGLAILCGAEIKNLAKYWSYGAVSGVIIISILALFDRK